MIKNVLLTGGTGFLGSHLLKQLLNSDFNVIVLARKSSNLTRIEHLKERFHLFYVDENTGNLSDLFLNNKIDAIIHTATEYGRDCPMSIILQSNLIFPIKLIEEAIKNNVKLFVNSDTFFGKPMFNNSSYLNEYTLSKKYLLDYLLNCTDKLKIVNMRLEHIFGEFDSENKFVTNILHQLIEDKSEILLTEGLQKRDFVYVEDVVTAYLKVLENNSELNNFTEFEVGRGESLKVREFVELLSEVTRSKSILKFGVIETRNGEIQDSVAVVSNLQEIGWQSNFTVKQAIQRMFEFELKENELK